jgi:hypothetical protein
MSPCNVVRYRRLNRQDPALRILGSQFCAECPDADDIPAACDASCDPGMDRFTACRRTTQCPCAREDSEARKRAFAVWLMARLEAARFREQAAVGAAPAPDGHTAVVWRALAQLLLDAISTEEQHEALSRWAGAVLARNGAAEQERLATLLRPAAPSRSAQEGGQTSERVVSQVLTERQRWAIGRARACDQVDSMDIARQFNVSRELGRQDLAVLVQLGLLVRKGTGRGTVYEIGDAGTGGHGGGETL